MTLNVRPQSRIGTWTRNDLGVWTFQGLGRNGPSWTQVVRRVARDLHSHALIKTLDCDKQPKQTLHRRCLPGCGHDTSATRDIETLFLYRLDPLRVPSAYVRCDSRGSGSSLYGLPCDWAQFLYTCAERELEDSHYSHLAQRGTCYDTAVLGHPDDLITSLLAYRWFEETRTHFRNQRNSNWKTAWNKE